jgi:hypothetical protein
MTKIKYEDLDLNERIRLDRAKDMIRDIRCNDKVWILFKRWLRQEFL